MLSSALLAACATAPAPPDTTISPMLGLSGMASIDRSSFVVVHDTKAGDARPRIGILTVGLDGVPRYRAVQVDDWGDPEGPANDLESICRLPGFDDEWLLPEAGTWQGRYGRVFRLRLDPAEARGEVIGVARLPVRIGTDRETEGDQYEGIACFSDGTGGVQVLLGERGGSAVYPHGALRWGRYDLDSNTLTFTESGWAGVRVTAPGKWTDALAGRDISALHLDDDGVLWAAATEEHTDAGPFYSVVYRLGRVAPGAEVPIVLDEPLATWREVAGLKVEGLAGPADAAPDSVLSIGTEGEALAPVWRALR